MREGLRYLGKISNVGVSRTSDKWFISVTCEVEQELFPYKEPRKVGVDLGIKNMAVTSDGLVFKSPKPLKNNLRRLKRYSRVLSKKQRIAISENRKLSTSKNYNKQKLKVSKLYYKTQCIRKDTINKVTSFLTNTYSDIAIEDLHVSGMFKNHKLSRAVSDIGFGEFRKQMLYKSEWKGVNLLLVDTFFPSSKLCCVCGFKKESLSLSERTFVCACGNKLDRDFNASINLSNKIGKVLPEYTPVEMTAILKSVYPILVTSINESGNKHPTNK